MGVSGTRCVGRRQMYKTFRVKNFRCFKDLQINDLGRVNLIAGKNNTGKTALLEAMYILTGSRDLKTLLRRANPLMPRIRRDMDEATQLAQSWSSIFSNLDSRKLVELSADDDRVHEQFKGQHSRFSVTISQLQDISATEDEALLELLDRRFDSFDESLQVLKFASNYEANDLYLVLESRGARPTRFKFARLYPANMSSTREKTHPHEITRRFDRVQKSKRLEVLVKLLQIFEPELTDLRLGTNDMQHVIEAELGFPQLIALNNLGDGMNRMLELILAMYEVRDGVIFIDEIENGLHYTIHNKIWRFLEEVSRQWEIQVFATTHSLEMIRAAHEAFKDDDDYEFRYHRLDRKPDGNIEAVTYNKFGMDAVAAFDFEHEVRG